MNVSDYISKIWTWTFHAYHT